jgi:predicted amidophosphoribosyltransferase
MFFIRRDEPAHCPHCGQRATLFAGACPLCGARLAPDSPRRARRAAGPLERAAARWRELLAARRR